MKLLLSLIFLIAVAIVATPSLIAQDQAAATPAPTAAPAPELPKHSIDIDVLAAYSYKQTLGVQSPEAKFNYAPMISYSYLIDPNNAISIVLFKFNHYVLSNNPVYNFSYGFQFRHSWHKEWADLGVFVPWISYGILLNWGVVNDREGAAIGHETRIALGTDIVLAPAHRLVIQLAWDNVSYPSFGTNSFEGEGSVILGIGYRLLF